MYNATCCQLAEIISATIHRSCCKIISAAIQKLVTKHEAYAYMSGALDVLTSVAEPEPVERQLFAGAGAEVF
jgi:hypothetical protein